MAAHAIALVLLLALAWQQWPVDRIERSLGRMDMDIASDEGPSRGTCTAFAIRRKPARYITAQHCVTDQNITVNGVPITVIATDEYDDRLGLAVIGVPTISPLSPVPLKIGKLPKKGDPVVALGYGHGAPQVIFFSGQVLSTDLPLPSAGPPRPAFFLNYQIQRGMSGGPVIDRDGRVVSVLLGGLSEEIAPGVNVPMEMTYGALYARLKKLMDAFGE